MRDLLNLIRWLLLGLVRSRRSLEADNLALRHQLTVLHRSAPKRPTLRNFDRLVFVCLYRIAPRILKMFARLNQVNAEIVDVERLISSKNQTIISALEKGTDTLDE